MADIKKIQAGQKVSDFIEELNDNFDMLNNESKTKQSTIYIMTAGETKINLNNDWIKVDADGVPSGGSNGDIVIVYETE